jgi:hypothetical protein
VCFLEELRWALPEAVDLRFHCTPFSGLRESIPIHRTFVSEMEEDVVRALCLHAALLRPKDQIDPMVEVLGRGERREREREERKRERERRREMVRER